MTEVEAQEAELAAELARRPGEVLLLLSATVELLEILLEPVHEDELRPHVVETAFGRSPELFAWHMQQLVKHGLARQGAGRVELTTRGADIGREITRNKLG